MTLEDLIMWIKSIETQIENLKDSISGLCTAIQMLKENSEEIS